MNLNDIHHIIIHIDLSHFMIFLAIYFRKGKNANKKTI
jgi:hypothetical protein